jgi:hypothetical protein
MIKSFLFLIAILFLFSAADLYAEDTAVPRFEIRQYVLEGNTLLSAGTVAGIFALQIGKERDFGDIQQKKVLQSACLSPFYYFGQPWFLRARPLQ